MRIALLDRFARDRRGAVLAEFGFVVPILVVILLGCYDATRFVLIHQKLDRIVTSMADLVARAEGISVAQVDDLFGAAVELAVPYDLTGHGRVMVSSVFRPTSSTPQVAWQRESPGTLSVTSRIGTAGGEATMPDGFVVRTGENVIVAEVWYDYAPLFTGFLFGDFELYHSAFNRPRIINLTVITP